VSAILSPAFLKAFTVLTPAFFILSPIFRSTTFFPKSFAAFSIFLPDSTKNEPIFPKKPFFSFFGCSSSFSKSALVIGL